jgi:hypothetical protein
MIYTAQYRYSDKDRIDITVKGGDIAGKLWAPTWDMVNGWKKGNITNEQYSQKYYELLTERWNASVDFCQSTLRLVDMVNGTKEMPARDVTFVCFCPPGTFCHRYLLVAWLQHNWNCQYGGER